MLRRLREERGANSILLLAAWGVVMAFLVMACDFVLAYIYQHQVRTAVEAAVTAGSKQAEYQMQVRLKRTMYQWEEQTKCDNGQCRTVKAGWKKTPADVTVGPGWEKDIWAPYRYRRQPLWQAYPEQCDRSLKKPVSYICQKAEVVADSCIAAERHPGAATQAAWAAYRANTGRWENQLEQVRVTQPPEAQAEGTAFGVTMAVEAEMPTMFLRLFGVDHLPIRVRSADLTENLGAELVRLGENPCQ